MILVIHHSLTSKKLEGKKQIKSFDRTHKDRLHKEANSLGYHIAYHYVIDGSGEVWKTRPEREIGYHASDFEVNKDSIGICLCGNFDKEKPNKEQLQSLEDLIIDIKKRHTIEKVRGHRHFSSKSCPGKNLTDQMIEDILSKIDAMNNWAKSVGIPEKTPFEIKKAINQLFKSLEKEYK